MNPIISKVLQPTAESEGPDGARTSVYLCTPIETTDFKGKVPVQFSWPRFLSAAELARWNAGGEKLDDLIWENIDRTAEQYLSQKAAIEKAAQPKISEVLKVPDLGATAAYRDKLKAERARLQTIIDAGEAAKLELAKLSASE